MMRSWLTRWSEQHRDWQEESDDGKPRESADTPQPSRKRRRRRGPAMQLDLDLEPREMAAGEAVVRYMYTQNLDGVDDDEELLHCMLLADRWLLPDCAAQCAARLQSTPVGSLSWRVRSALLALPPGLAVASAHVAQLQTRVEAALMRSFRCPELMWEDPDNRQLLLSLPAGRLEQLLLAREDVQVTSENAVLAMLSAWLQHNPAAITAGIACGDNAEPPSEVEALLRLVRYRLLTPHYRSAVAPVLPGLRGLRLHHELLAAVTADDDAAAGEAAPAAVMPSGTPSDVRPSNGAPAPSSPAQAATSAGPSPSSSAACLSALVRDATPAPGTPAPLDPTVGSADGINGNKYGTRHADVSYPPSLSRACSLSVSSGAAAPCVRGVAGAARDEPVSVSASASTLASGDQGPASLPLASKPQPQTDEQRDTPQAALPPATARAQDELTVADESSESAPSKAAAIAATACQTPALPASTSAVSAAAAPGGESAGQYNGSVGCVNAAVDGSSIPHRPSSPPAGCDAAVPTAPATATVDNAGPGPVAGSTVSAPVPAAAPRVLALAPPLPPRLPYNMSRRLEWSRDIRDVRIHLTGVGGPRQGSDGAAACQLGPPVFLGGYIWHLATRFMPATAAAGSSTPGPQTPSLSRAPSASAFNTPPYGSAIAALPSAQPQSTAPRPQSAATVGLPVGLTGSGASRVQLQLGIVCGAPPGTARVGPAFGSGSAAGQRPPAPLCLASCTLGVVDSAGKAAWQLVRSPCPLAEAAAAAAGPSAWGPGGEDDGDDDEGGVGVSGPRWEFWSGLQGLEPSWWETGSALTAGGVLRLTGILTLQP